MSESAIFFIVSFFLLQPVRSTIASREWFQSLSFYHGTMLITAYSSTITQHFHTYSFKNSPWLIKLFTALPYYCPLHSTPFSNLVCMCTHSLIPQSKTLVTGLGTRLVHRQNCELTSCSSEVYSKAQI